MNDRKIFIPPDALAQTKQICSEELHVICEKQSDSFFTLILRFLRIDLTFYVQVTFIGLIAMMAVNLMFPQSTTLPLSMYFFSLGCMNVYESYKNEMYQTTELFRPVYLHQGRVFLYRNATTAFLQCLVFVMILILQSVFLPLSFVSAFMSSFLPLWIAQIVVLVFIGHIHRLRYALLLYISIFAIYNAGYYRFKTYVLTYVNVPLITLIFIVVASFFIIILFVKTKQKEVGFFGIEHNPY